MTDWTPPTHVVSGTEIDSVKHNEEVVDNLLHLRSAQLVRLGRIAALAIPNNAWTGVPWDYQAHDTMDSWSSTPYPERIYATRPGFYRVSAQFLFPGDPVDPPGIRSIRCERISTGGSVVVIQSPAIGGTRSTAVSLAANVELNGTTDYLYVSVYQDSGGTLTSAFAASHSFDLEWIGA